MKRLLMIALIAAASVTNAQNTSKQEVAPELVEQRETLKKEITTDYLVLKNNLLISDSVAVSANAKGLADALAKFKFKKLTLDQMNLSTTTRKEIIDLANEIAGTKNINKQRKAFATLSTKFWDIAARLKPMDLPLYQQVCPMTGETWLSDSKEIKNPYYPKNMLTCGEVKASL